MSHFYTESDNTLVITWLLQNLNWMGVGVKMEKWKKFIIEIGAKTKIRIDSRATHSSSLLNHWLFIHSAISSITI